MADWAEGYTHEVDYTYGYYNELNPLNARFALLSAGYEAPDIKSACELGFGQGLSLNFHAAGSQVAWYGNDFNPSQAAFAQKLAGQSSAHAVVSDESFEEFCVRDDLPEFDFIGLHGIWSWVSPDNRQHIVDFASKKLKVGGVLYVSYNTLPGSYSAAPLRHLLHSHVERYGSAATEMQSKIDLAMDFCGEVLEQSPKLKNEMPALSKRQEFANKSNRNYLAHEFLNKDWEPMYFAQVSEMLKSAKLSFVTSAFYPDTVTSLNVNKEADAFLKTISDSTMRETVLDYLVNRNFRRDYWVKGPCSISQTSQIQHLSKLSIALVKQPADVELKLKTGTYELGLVKEIYEPLLKALSDFKSHTIGDVANIVAEGGVGFGKLIQAIGVLKSKGDIRLVWDESEKVIQQARKLNNFILGQAVEDNTIPYLVCTKSGGAVVLNRMQQLFVKQYISGTTKAANIAKFTHQTFKRTGIKLVVNGKQLETDKENYSYIEKAVEDFFEVHFPILKEQLSL